MNKNETKEYIKNLMDTPRVIELRKRARRCKCKYCGGNLRLKQIVYGKTIEPRIEIFCENCKRIEYGIEPEIYEMAKYYVDEFSFDCYPELDDSISKERMNVAKVAEIIYWGMNGVGYADMGGFIYPIKIDKKMVGESIEFDMDELAELDDTLKEAIKNE